MSDLAVAHDELRPLMFSIAYRMLGSVAEAEDVVQEAFFRMHRSGRAGVDVASFDAYATTITTRLAIDALRSVRMRRERDVGPWLPEPLLAGDDDPGHRIETDETVSVAFLILLERLSPLERAVFVLREVFGYEYEEIARVVERGEDACRQLMSRARRHLDEGPPAIRTIAS
jgi:RNA polymerase sigma-70 factor (ECF subfamily)